MISSLSTTNKSSTFIHLSMLSWFRSISKHACAWIEMCCKLSSSFLFFFNTWNIFYNAYLCSDILYRLFTWKMVYYRYNRYKKISEIFRALRKMFNTTHRNIDLLRRCPNEQKMTRVFSKQTLTFPSTAIETHKGKSKRSSSKVIPLLCRCCCVSPLKIFIPMAISRAINDAASFDTNCLRVSSTSKAYHFQSLIQLFARENVARYNIRS